MPKDPCSELAKKITELAMHIGARPEVKNLDDVVSHMQKLVPQIDRTSLVASINEATTGYAKARDVMGKRLDALKREARSDVKLRAKIVAMENALRAGETLPTTVRGTTEPSPSMVALRDRSAELQAALRQSDAAIKKRYLADIQNLTDRLENGVFTLPEPKAKRPMDMELAKLDYQRFELKRQIARKMEALRPRTVWGKISEPLNAARAIMTSYDLSAVLRQGQFVVLSHPIRSAKALPDMFRALTSEKKAYEISKAISERENAPLYHRDGLFLSEAGADGLSPQEETFVSRLAGKVPGVKASERAYVTFLNSLRADAYDAASQAFGHGGVLDQQQGEAIANFINVATGRGKFKGKWQNAANAMNTVFFAPRYATSRFQLLFGQPLWGGTAETRKYIAKEYAKYLAGLGVVYSLGAIAGGELEGDPRSTDFGKIRFGETRIDPTGGIAAATRMIARVFSRKTVTAEGDVKPADAWEETTRFVRGKLAPLPGASFDILSGKNVVGERATPMQSLGRMVTPMGFRDIYDALREQDIPHGTAMALLSIAGESVNTYGPRTESRAVLSDLESAGLKNSGIYASIKGLADEYQNATRDRRTVIEKQLARLNSKAKEVIKKKPED